MPKISVIVPAYNAEKYLCETLDCLAAQTLPDIEVIIVNDGSTDTTQAIIDEYCAGISDDIIYKSITQPNGGVSVARNTGLEAAQGEYVLFLDSDDLLTAGTLEAFYSALKVRGADLAIGRLQNFGAVKESFNPFAEKLANKDKIDMFDKDLLWNFLPGNKCYNREKLINSGVRFPLLKYSEDGAFFMAFVLFGVKITGTPDACMKYRRHSTEEGISVSQSVNIALVKDFMASMTHIYDDAVKALETAPSKVNRDDYLQEILLKTDHTLIAQFYRLFWKADQDCLCYIGEQHEMLVSKMTAKKVNEIKMDNAELPSFIFDKKELAEKPQVTVIIGDCGGSDVSQTINSVFAQSMPAFELILPVSLSDKGKIPEQWRGCENIKPLPNKNFWREAKKAAKSTRILRIKKPFKLDERFFRFILKLEIPAILKDRFFNELFYALTIAVKARGL